MKKTNASSDKKNNGENFLPAETLWRAAQMIRQKGVEVSPIDAEPAPLELLGLAIGILRKRKHISRKNFARKIGCSVEELLALETGLLPAGDIAKYLPLIVHEINVPEKFIQPFLRDFKFA